MPPVHPAEASLVARPDKVLVPLGEAAPAVRLVDAIEVGALVAPVEADVDDIRHRIVPAASIGHRFVSLAVVKVPDGVGALREARGFLSFLARLKVSARGEWSRVMGSGDYQDGQVVCRDNRGRGDHGGGDGGDLHFGRWWSGALLIGLPTSDTGQYVPEM